jgi:hypothetical protein
MAELEVRYTSHAQVYLPDFGKNLSWDDRHVRRGFDSLIYLDNLDIRIYATYHG